MLCFSDGRKSLYCIGLWLLNNLQICRAKHSMKTKKILIHKLVSFVPVLINLCFRYKFIESTIPYFTVRLKEYKVKK